MARYTRAMTSAAFDTLQAAHQLQEAGIDRRQAEAIAHIVGLRGDDYATKGDMSALEARLVAKIETFGAKIETYGAQIETKVEEGKNVILRSILTASVAIIVTLIGGFFAIAAAG